MDIKEIDIIGDYINYHWYYRSKANALLKLTKGIKKSIIIDIGAGSGYFSRYLLRNTSANEAWCVDINYDTEYDCFEIYKPMYFRKKIDYISADLVLVMDVLEHVDNDVALLCDYISKVPRGTTFVISVPAFSFLWSSHDVFLEHKRRYSLSELEHTVRESGLHVKFSSYYYAAVFPIAAISRLAGKFNATDNCEPRSQLKRHSRPINKALYAMCQAELPILPRNRLFGLTAFCLAIAP